ncbi:MAG TPA: hypothetical protein VGJ57_09785 [Nitrospirales bacterium]|jgi:hypothetical protein
MARRWTLKKQAVLRREDGIAMLTILMLTLILTVIGIAAITTTTMDLKLAGGELMRETSMNTAEACVSTSVQIIQQTLANSNIPASLLAADPNVQIFPNPLRSEIMGEANFDQLNDTADFQNPLVAPNVKLLMGGFTVNIDIDRLFIRPIPGGTLKAADGYSSGVPSFEILYRISCYSSGGSGSIGYITGVYACPLDKGVCRRQIGG